MSKGIRIATTDVRTATVNEKVVDSTLPGSWKIAKRINFNQSMTRASGGAITQTLSADHNLGFTPAFLAMVESDFGLKGMALYNIPTFAQSISLKVSVDSKKVYATIVMGLTGTFQFNFKIALLGEKIE